MIQTNEQVNNNEYNLIYEERMRAYFKQGKLYNFWEQQLPNIINNNIKWRSLYNEFFYYNNQQDEQNQEYIPQKDEIIYIGEKFKLQGYCICQLYDKKLAPIHFKLFQSFQIFLLVWIKCLRQQLKSLQIGKIIAQFCGYGYLDLTDISNSQYESYLQIQKNIPFVLKSNRNKFCLPYTVNENAQNKHQYVNFEISQLESETIKNITVGQLFNDRIFFSGTENFEIQNQYLCDLQQENVDITELQVINSNRAHDLLDFQSDYMNALLITVNASFIKVLLVPNQQNDYQLISDDDTFSTEFQKYSQILPILKFINGNWQIEHEFLCRKLEKNQRETVKSGRIITISNNGISDHQLLYNCTTKIIQYNKTQ